MKKFVRGQNYLTRLHDSEKKGVGVYRCEICLNEISISDYKVESGHDKTCGCRNGKILNFNITKEGYILSLGGYDLSSKKAKGYRGFMDKYVHRMVAEKFIPNKHGFTDINHINGDKSDNRIENLEWCSRSYNIKHAWKEGLRTRKESNPCSTRPFDEAQIIEIRQSNKPHSYFSKKYNVSVTTISRIRNKKSYRDISYKLIEEYESEIKIINE